MDGHTPEPWELGGVAEIALTFDREINIFPPSHEKTGGYQYGGPIAVVAVSEDAGQSANAIRIVACINATAGIPTDALLAGCVAKLVAAATDARTLISAVVVGQILGLKRLADSEAEVNRVVDQLNAALALVRGDAPNGGT